MFQNPARSPRARAENIDRPLFAFGDRSHDAMRGQLSEMQVRGEPARGTLVGVIAIVLVAIELARDEVRERLLRRLDPTAISDNRNLVIDRQRRVRARGAPE